MYRNFGKRILDVAVTLPLLMCATPLLLFAIVVIKLFSSGPVFFLQERVGRNRVTFCIYKFRTMHVRPHGNAGSSVTTSCDPRVFFGGAFLRKTKIDELPQFLNVLNGSMSLVGPRPTVEDDYRKMTPEQQRRCLVRPGVTGWAQIRGNTSLSWPQRLKLDCKYVECHSLLLDLRILAETAWLVFTMRAETHPAGEDEWSEAA